jgi:nucleoside-diphosphate-sugar epimerase
MRVLLTGATGFIGSALRQRLLESQHTIVSVARRKADEGISVIEDIGANTDWNSLLTGCDTVVHLAACVHVTSEFSVAALTKFHSVNVLGSANLARQAATAGVKRFVFLSSIKVNGESTPPGLPFKPDDEPNPDGAYAASKYEAEQELLEVAKQTGIELVIIRPPLVYGPGVKGNFAAMIRWVRGGVPLPLGSVQNQRSFVALDNLVDLIVLCTDRNRSPTATNQVFLVSDGEDVSTPEILHKIALSYGCPKRLLPVPTCWMRFVARVLGKCDTVERVLGSLTVDDHKTREMLGWRPIISMDEQLRKIANVANG